MKQQSKFKIKYKKNHLLIISIICIAAILLFYKITSLIPFIGDQGWFYISARNMLLTGQVPLVGITSSHIWLHQGPYWTYMLAGALWVSHFNPVSGAFLTATLGLFTVWLIFKIGSEMFSQKIGLISALLYATSPAIIINSRMAYHTAPISLLTLLLFYALYKWINGYRYGLPIIIVLFALLYNFETATFMLVPVFVLLLIYGFFKKTTWVKDILNPKMLLLSLVGWVIVMIPMLLYDVHHGFPQTLKFDEWLVYKIATVFGFPQLHPDAQTETLQSMFPFATARLQEIIFINNSIISWLILLVSGLNLIFINKKLFKKHNYLQPYSLLLLFFIIPTIGYIIEKTNSGAYIILFFPSIIFMLALVFDNLMNIRKLFIPAIIILFIYVFCNIFALFQTNYLTNTNPLTLSKRIGIVKQMIQESHGKAYNLEGKGNSSQYISFTTGYEYLAWWMGDGPSQIKQPLRFYIQETPTNIILTKQIMNRNGKE